MATKKGPLSKVEVFYIEGNKDTKDAKEIASDLNRNLKPIVAHIEKLAAESPKSEPVVSKQFARQSGTVTMTENASQMTDAKRPHRKTGVLSSRHQNCVTKIRD